jgi:hypothetical protein
MDQIVAFKIIPKKQKKIPEKLEFFIYNEPVCISRRGAHELPED